MIEIEVFVKGGLPLTAQAEHDEAGFTLHWSNGREITAAVWNSIPDSELREIEMLINDRADTYLQDEWDARGDYEYEQRRDRYL